MNIISWLTSISVQLASTANKYGQFTYTTISINGRLVLKEYEVVGKDGEKLLCKAKLFTTSDLTLDSKIQDFKVIVKKECKDKNNTIVFYAYGLV